MTRSTSDQTEAEWPVMMTLRRLAAALTGAVIASACGLMVSGPADAAVSLKIASPVIQLGCGGGGAYPLIEMIWGPSCEMVSFSFTGSTVSKKDTFKVSVTPKPKEKPYLFAEARRAGAGEFGTLADAYKLGTTYTFTLSQYSHKKLVATARSTWTPAYLKGPRRGYDGAPTASNGLPYYVAGKSYSLSFNGTWEAGTRIHAEVAVVDANQSYKGELLTGKRVGPPSTGGPVGIGGDEGQDYKLYKPGQKISFTVPVDYTGGWIIVSLVGEKKDKLWWGFIWDDAQIVPDEQTLPKKPLTDDELGHDGRVTYPGDEATTGTVLSFDPKLPAKSTSLGISYTYQWYRETYDESTGQETDTDIDGATGPTYTISDADAGSDILVRVTYTPSDADYAAVTRTFEGAYLDDEDE